MYSEKIYDLILIEDLEEIKNLVNRKEINPIEKDNDYFTYAFFHHKYDIVNYFFSLPSVREKVKVQNINIYNAMNKSRIQNNVKSILD